MKYRWYWNIHNERGIIHAFGIIPIETVRWECDGVEVVDEYIKSPCGREEVLGSDIVLGVTARSFFKCKRCLKIIAAGG